MLEVAAQRRFRDPRKRRAAIAIALGLADQELPAREVDVLDAQPQRFEQAQPAAVEQRGDETMNATQLGEHRPHLVAREHDRKRVRAGGPDCRPQALDLASQHRAIQEQDRCQRLILRRGGDAPPHREVREERHHLEASHRFGMALAVEQDEAADPVDVGVFGAAAQMAQARRRSDAVQKPRRRSRG